MANNQAFAHGGKNNVEIVEGITMSPLSQLSCMKRLFLTSRDLCARRLVLCPHARSGWRGMSGRRDKTAGGTSRHCWLSISGHRRKWQKWHVLVGGNKVWRFRTPKCSARMTTSPSSSFGALGRTCLKTILFVASCIINQTESHPASLSFSSSSEHGKRTRFVVPSLFLWPEETSMT